MVHVIRVMHNGYALWFVVTPGLSIFNMKFKKTDLYIVFRSIKHYFLLDQGDFIVQFMDMADDELKKSMEGNL